jgi:hypothetical protein
MGRVPDPRGHPTLVREWWAKYSSTRDQDSTPRGAAMTAPTLYSRLIITRVPCVYYYYSHNLNLNQSVMGEVYIWLCVRCGRTLTCVHWFDM